MLPIALPDTLSPEQWMFIFQMRADPGPLWFMSMAAAGCMAINRKPGCLPEVMTAQGYLVVSINYRLYPAGKFPAMIQDVKCAIRSLRANASEYNLDPNRIGAIGRQRGRASRFPAWNLQTQSAGWDVGEYLDQSSRVQAVIAMAGVTDLSRNFPNADIETMKRVGFGEYNVAEASPITHVTADDSALFADPWRARQACSLSNNRN